MQGLIILKQQNYTVSSEEVQASRGDSDKAQGQRGATAGPSWQDAEETKGKRKGKQADISFFGEVLKKSSRF